MSKIFNYITNMLPYMLIFLLIYIPIRLFIRRGLEKKPNVLHEILLAVFLIFLSGLLSLTILPRNNYSVAKGSINIIPFRTIISYFDESLINFQILFIGNIIMFMPIGFFIPLLWKKKGLFTCIFGALFSLFIEITQLFIGRNTDIDDLILNTFGVYLGYLLYLLLKRIKANSST